MSDMIQRVALAIEARQRRGWFRTGSETAAEIEREKFKELARAAIEAMRDPDQELFDAFWEEVSDVGPGPSDSLAVFSAAFNRLLDAAAKP